MQQIRAKVQDMVERGGHYPYPSCRPRSYRLTCIVALALATAALVVALMH